MEYTDPAKELADACQRLATQQNQSGAEFLATVFGVGVWSKEFYGIIISFQDRIEYVSEIVEKLDLDEDIKNEAKSHLASMKNSFSNNALQTSWASFGAHHIGSNNYQPIRMLSGNVRSLVKYPKLNDEQTSEVIGLVDQLLEWLEEHQVNDSDFIRQLIIDGAKEFRFRFSKIGWLGYGYSMEPLREVIHAYLALERSFPDLNVAPDAGAVLMKVSGFLKNTYEKVGVVKNVVESGDFLLRMYGALSIARQFPVVSGLLSGH